MRSRNIALLVIFLLVFTLCFAGEAQGQVFGNSVTSGPSGGGTGSSRGSSTLGKFNRFSTSISDLQYSGGSRSSNVLAGRGGGFGRSVPSAASGRGLARLYSRQVSPKVYTGRIGGLKARNNYTYLLGLKPTMMAANGTGQGRIFEVEAELGAVSPIRSKEPDFMPTLFNYDNRPSDYSKSRSLAKINKLDQIDSMSQAKPLSKIPLYTQD